MRKLSLIVVSMSVLFTLNSCDKEKSSEGLSRQTNYPTFEMMGDPVIFQALGDPYTDPGVTATEGGDPIPVTTSAVGNYWVGSVPNVDPNQSDYYSVSYSAKNKDGFTGTESRDVYVVETGDLVTSIAGLYTSTVVRNGSAGAQYTDMEYILISDNGDGTYNISCGIGGYYSFGRAYGLGYIAPAVVTANDISNNDFSFTDFSVNTFGGVCTMTSMSVDATAKTIDFVTDWSFGYQFVVTLTQVQI